MEVRKVFLGGIVIGAVDLSIASAYLFSQRLPRLCVDIADKLTGLVAAWTGVPAGRAFVRLKDEAVVGHEKRDITIISCFITMFLNS